MKWTRYIAGIILAMTFMAGCSHVSQMNLLVEAQSFLPAEPDSADARLKRVDVQQFRDEEEEARYALLRTMTDALQHKTPLNDTLVHRAYNFYSSKSNLGASSDQTLVRHFAQSALYMGDWYMGKDSIKASEDCYRQAIGSSEKVQDWHTCYIAYERLAGQIQWSNEEEALELINRAINIYEKCNDDITNLLSLYHCAAHYTYQIAYLHGGDFQDAIALAQKEYDLAVENRLQLYENQSMGLLALIYWTQGKYQLALGYAKQIQFSSFNKDYEQAWNRTLAQCYLSCDSLAQAKRVLNHLQSTSDKKEAYLYARELAEISIRSEERDSAIQYMDSAFSDAEAMFLDALHAKDDYYQDNLGKEKLNEQLIYRDKLKTWGFGVLVFVLLMVGSFAAWILMLKLRMHGEKLRNAEETMMLMQERQTALEDSQQKKAAAIKYLQRYIIDRTHITTKLKDTTTRVDMSPKEWKDIEMLLDEIDEGRISKIRARYKDLSVDDIHLCMMVRIGMSNLAIGNVFCISPSAVQHRKQTLKKKGFGVTDPDVTLDAVIESL